MHAVKRQNADSSIFTDPFPYEVSKSYELVKTLSYWSIIAGYRLVGFNATGMRLYSAMSMLLTMLILTWWTKWRYGAVASVVMLALLCANEAIFGFHFARWGDADAQATLLCTLAMLCMLQSKQNIRWLYGSALCFGLMFLSKSWHAGVIPAVCLAYVCATGIIKKMKPRHYLGVLFWDLLPILPWAIARYTRDGLAFFENMFMTDLYMRSTTVLKGHEGDWLYYVRYFVGISGLLTAGSLCAMGIGTKLFRKTRIDSTQMGLALWFLVPLLFYSAVATKRYWYSFPCVMPLAVGGRIAASRLLRIVKSRASRPMLVACALAVILSIEYQRATSIMLIRYAIATPISAS